MHDQYTHVRVITFTQLSELLPVDRYQSQHPSSTQMSESSPDTNNFTDRRNLPSHFISHSQINIIHMFTCNYRKCTLSWEFNLIKRALNWELALPGKSGSQISLFVFSICLIFKESWRYLLVVCIIWDLNILYMHISQISLKSLARLSWNLKQTWLVHRCQSHHQDTIIRVFTSGQTSIQMSESSPVHKYQRYIGR